MKPLILPATICCLVLYGPPASAAPAPTEVRLCAAALTEARSVPPTDRIVVTDAQPIPDDEGIGLQLTYHLSSTVWSEALQCVVGNDRRHFTRLMLIHGPGKSDIDGVNASEISKEIFVGPEPMMAVISDTALTQRAVTLRIPGYDPVGPAPP